MSVESDNEKHRIKTLAEVPAAIRFISAEPLIGELNLSDYKEEIKNCYQWIIIGGESGNKTGKYLFRKCELGWIKNLIAQSKEYGLSVFVKQLGTYLASISSCKDKHGGDITEWRKSLQIREFPEDVSGFNLETK